MLCIAVLPMIVLRRKTEELIKRMDALEVISFWLERLIEAERIMDIEFIIETRLAQDIHAVAEGHSFVNSKLAYLIETIQSTGIFRWQCIICIMSFSR